MADTPNRKFLRKCVAKICQNVGWNFIQATPLELLTDLLQEYITSVAKTAYSYALHCGNTEANISHLALAFKDMGVSVSDLKEYVRYVDSSSISDVPKYPIPKENHLNMLKPGSREVVTRPFHIHEHLPPMHPHLEDQELSLKQSPLGIDNTSETSTPANSPKSKFKRPGDPLSDLPLSKRSRYCEEEDRPLRELSSVMMTTSGFLSPAREGKLPEARTPVIKTELQTVDNSSPSNDTKQEKKKKKVIPESKKVEKDLKSNHEPEGELSKEEDVKSKKIATNKDQVKQKSKKLFASKLSTSGAESTSSAINKAQKHVSKKTQSSVVLPLSTVPNLVKKPKIEKPIHQLKREDHTPSSVSAPENQINPDYKLSCEPDKQKLNIFKRISKVKEDTMEEVTDKGETEIKDFSQIDITIESVIKREMVQAEVEIPIEVKDEVVDIETVQSPNPYSSLVSNNKINVPPLVPNPVLTKSDKKKKKDKNKVKKDLSEKSNIENNSTKSKTLMNYSTDLIEPECVETAVEPAIVPVSFVPCPLPTAPGLIPSTMSLVPQILGTISKSEQNHSNTCSEQSKTSMDVPHNISPTEPIITSSPILVATDGSNKNEDSPIKKKEHKKDKKEKIKKKKKNKLKNKDKSEKKKLKLEKKGKLKDKIKQKRDKKEKRKDKEIDEGTNDSASGVPKITFKLGPASPVDSTNENILRKIVIKPVLKKENDVPKSERAPSPELARFSPLIQPKHKPKVQTSENAKCTPTSITTSPSSITTNTITTTTTTTTTVSATTVSTSTEVPTGPIESLSLPPSLRFDSEGNKVWICPGCERQDDGSAMIGCDGCDAWYHWVCVGIQVAPESKLWYCTICLNKEKESTDKKKKSKKKNGSKKAK